MYAHIVCIYIYNCIYIYIYTIIYIYIYIYHKVVVCAGMRAASG